MGLFERSKHLERLAREIADQNLRQLGSKPAPVDDEESRRQILEQEALLRDYRFHLDEAEARAHLAATREGAAREKAARWLENAALARDRKREEMAAQAAQRALVFEREADSARVEGEHQAATISRLRHEIAGVEHRIAVLRALRKGEAATLPAPPPTRRAAATGRLASPPRDPLEEAFDALRGEG